MTPIIEYLLSLNRPGGGNLCFPHRMQFIIPQFPPLTTLSFNLYPPLGVYAAIKYASSISPQGVPGAIYMEITQAGSMYAQGFGEADWTRESLPYFVVFTQGKPIYIQLSNVTALHQRLAATQFNLLIPSKDDLDNVYRHLDAYGGGITGRAGEAANVLLSQIVSLLKGAR